MGENLWKMKPVTTISKVYDIIWTDLDFRYSCVWHIWYDTCSCVNCSWLLLCFLYVYTCI